MARADAGQSVVNRDEPIPSTHADGTPSDKGARTTLRPDAKHSSMDKRKRSANSRSKSAPHARNAVACTLAASAVTR